MRGRRLSRPPRPPSSACPRCYRENEPLGYLADSHLYTFHCACGEHWVTATKTVKAHTDWLRRAHHQADVSDR